MTNKLDPSDILIALLLAATGVLVGVGAVESKYFELVATGVLGYAARQVGK